MASTRRNNRIISGLFVASLVFAGSALYLGLSVGVMTPKLLEGLPRGDPSAGLITGTSASTGTSNLTISCTNAAGQAATRKTTLTVNAPDPASRLDGG
jgi:putative Ig domain-containing protein